MKEQEQSLPLLEDEASASPNPQNGRYLPHSLRFGQTCLVVALGLYSLLVTGIVLSKSLPRATVTAPYCKMATFAKKNVFIDESQAPASHLLQFEQQKANPDKHTIYSDPPSSEVDKAWDDLVRRKTHC